MAKRAAALGGECGRDYSISIGAELHRILVLQDVCVRERLNQRLPRPGIPEARCLVGRSGDNALSIRAERGGEIVTAALHDDEVEPVSRQRYVGRLGVGEADQVFFMGRQHTLDVVDDVRDQMVVPVDDELDPLSGFKEIA